MGGSCNFQEIPIILKIHYDCMTMRFYCGHVMKVHIFCRTWSSFSLLVLQSIMNPLWTMIFYQLSHFCISLPAYISHFPQSPSIPFSHLLFDCLYPLCLPGFPNNIFYGGGDFWSIHSYHMFRPSHSCWLY